MRSYLFGPNNGKSNLILTKTSRQYRSYFPRKGIHLFILLHFFNGFEVVIKTEHKHLGMILDSKLTFLSHIKEAIVKARRGIGIIRFLSKYVTRDDLDQIYKLYVRPHLDYGEIIYHKYDLEFKLDFTKRLESTQYSAALAVSGAWRGTNTDKIYKELGWKILYYRRWYRRLCHFYKLQSDQRPLYLHNEIPHERTFSYKLRRPNVSKIVLENGTN